MPFTIKVKQTPWHTDWYGNDLGIMAKVRAQNPTMEFATFDEADAVRAQMIDAVDAVFNETSTIKKGMGAPDRYYVEGSA